MTGYSAGSSINKIGSSNGSAASINGTSPLLTAAANVNGAILRTLVVVQGAAGFLSVFDTVGGEIAYTGSSGTVFTLPAPLYLPPGHGVSVSSGATGVGNAYGSWDLL